MSEKGLCPISMVTLALCLHNEQNLHELQLGIAHPDIRDQALLPNPPFVLESQTQVPEN